MFDVNDHCSFLGKEFPQLNPKKGREYANTVRRTLNSETYLSSVVEGAQQVALPGARQRMKTIKADTFEIVVFETIREELVGMKGNWMFTYEDVEAKENIQDW